jgi:hypothetical protein
VLCANYLLKKTYRTSNHRNDYKLLTITFVVFTEENVFFTITTLSPLLVHSSLFFLHCKGTKEEESVKSCTLEKEGTADKNKST